MLLLLKERHFVLLKIKNWFKLFVMTWWLVYWMFSLGKIWLDELGITYKWRSFKTMDFAPFPIFVTHMENYNSVE